MPVADEWCVRLSVPEVRGPHCPAATACNRSRAQAQQSVPRQLAPGVTPTPPCIWPVPATRCPKGPCSGMFTDMVEVAGCPGRRARARFCSVAYRCSSSNIAASARNSAYFVYRSPCATVYFWNVLNGSPPQIRPMKLGPANGSKRLRM